MTHRPGGNLYTMTARVIHVVQLVVVASESAGGDSRVATVTGSPFWWRNLRISHGRHSAVYRVKFYQNYDWYRDDFTDRRLYVPTVVTFQSIDINLCVLWKRTTKIKHPLKRKNGYLWWPLCCRWQSQARSVIVGSQWSLSVPFQEQVTVPINNW